MPNSKIRRSTRKREPPQKFEAVEVSSPSRPAKRRRGNATSPVRPEVEPCLDNKQEQENTGLHENEVEEPLSDAEDEDEERAEIERRNEQVEAFIPHLQEGPEPINAQQQHPNVDRFVTAVAKIAGRYWTFYPRSSCITIGRQGEKKLGRSGEEESVEVEEPSPDIDLGPGKHVSREHAEIRYEDDERWHLTVRGRNGAKVNNVLVKRAQRAVIESGDVIEIAGTEMIFVSAVSPATIQDTYLERLNHPPEQLARPPSHVTTDSAYVIQKSLPSLHSAGDKYDKTSGQFISPYGPPVMSDSSGVGGRGGRSVTPTNAVVQQHPYLAQQLRQSKLRPLMLDGSEQIDYSSDANKDIKPPMSYATLIAQAILAGPNERSSLSGIYDWIKINFAYYRHIEPGWQNSIRHNLSLNQAFDKIARESHEPGKGGMWFIVPERKDDFIRMGWKMTSRGGARPSSNPSSPVPPKNRSPKRRTPPRPVVASQETQSPNVVQRQPVQLSQTPLRQTMTAAPLLKIDPTPQLIDDTSPLPVRQAFAGGSRADVAGSPTILLSGLLDGPVTTPGPFANPFTPAPRRQEPSFQAPSTAKLPSQYLLQSSPAPFWRDFGTPSALPQTSPAKADPKLNSEVPASSSPPREGANESPTRIRPKTEIEPGISEPSKMSKDQPESVQLDLMGSFPKFGDGRVVDTAH